MRRHILISVLLTAGLAATVAHADSPPLPKPADGWRIELVEQAPKIVYPTAIVCAPDGTIFLGQDPMDMPGPPTVPIDSIVAIKNGKITTFADKLWAVMGLEFIDGALYVVHPPFLTSFRDTNRDGKADERVDLVSGLGPKLPGFSGINDHVASGIRLGMDGFLYISVGDKGIPKAIGKDGATIQLFGGGVIRVRPDGTGLEVVSTGERNPLSVALSETDEIFTYGNDDDSKRWPNSLTHHIIGGHYGYPYQFATRPDRCLPIMGGELGGSGCQAICYNDDGLPEAYRGNVLACDWGTQEVVRFELAKSGGTFKIARKSLLVEKGDVADFRPFSLCVAGDRSAIYLVDWAFGGWLSGAVKTGRLYKLTYDGRDRVAPSPAPANAIAGLDHAALSVRLAAQRSVVGQRELLAEKLNAAGPARGRIHALWALDADSTPAARRAIRDALRDKSAGVRLQAARSAGIRRDREATSGLIALLKDDDAAVRREAAIALGQIGDPAVAPELYAALGDSDSFAAWSVRRAIRQLKAWDKSLLVESLLDSKRAADALKLTDEAYAVPVVDALIEAMAKTTDGSIRAKLVANLAGLYLRYPEWTGNWFGTNPLAGTMPVKTRPWSTEGMARVVAGLSRAVNDSDASVRLEAIAGLRAVGRPAAAVLRSHLEKDTDPRVTVAIATALGSARDAESAPLLAKLVGESARTNEARTAALDALALIPGPIALRARLALLYDKKAPAELVARGLPGLAQAKVLPPADVATFLNHPSPLVRAAAVAALGGRAPLPPEAKQGIVERIDDPTLEVRNAAIAASGGAKVREAIPKLIELARDQEVRIAAVKALCALPDPRAIPFYLEALDDRDPVLRAAAEQALLAIRDLAAPSLEAKARSGSLRGPAADAIERILTRFKPIEHWRVIGPFARTTADVFFGEASIDFAKPRSGAEGRSIRWSERPTEPGTAKVVLNDFKEGAGDRGGFGYDTNGSPDLAAFAFAEIQSDEDRPALLLVGSSGTLSITINETFVYNYTNFAGRGFGPDTDRVRVQLKKGANRLLLRTRQGIGTWAFAVQVSEPSASFVAVRPGKTSLEELRSFATAHSGDPNRGAAIFFDPRGLGCVKCHAAAGKGTASVGPDLSGLALKYDKNELIRSVLEPSSRIATGYQPLLIALRDGSVISGLLRSESSGELELIDADAKVSRVAKREVEERRVGDVSLMPTGLVDTLTPQEFTDLIAFLQSLKAIKR